MSRASLRGDGRTLRILAANHSEAMEKGRGASPEIMILRIYADAEGETHFEDVEFAFDQTDLVPPAPPVLMTALEDASRYGFELVHPGWHGDWHPVPQRLLAVYLSGAGTIEASDGELRHLLPGTILLAEDTIGKGHISRVTGAEDMLVLILMLPDLLGSDPPRGGPTASG